VRAGEARTGAAAAGAAAAGARAAGAGAGVAATAAAAAAAAAAATAALPAVASTCEWPSGPWSSFPFSRQLTISSYLRSYVSPCGPISGCFLSSSVTIVSSCSPFVLPSPPKSSLTASTSTPITDYYRACCPVVTRVLASLVTDPCASPSSISALTTAVADFATTRRLDYATRVVPARPLSVGGECALGCHILEDRQFEQEFLATSSPHLCAMLLAPEGDPDALDIPTPRTYREAVSGQWASQWIAAMESEMASWRSTGTYVDTAPPPRTNIVDGMWLFKVKRPPGSPPVFKACYMARGFDQRKGVDFFQTFAPTPKMTTLRVLLHVTAQRDYKLHSLDFSTAFFQGSLHEEIWLRRPPGFTGTFLPGNQWSLRRPIYSLRQAPRPTPFFVLIYVNDLVFAAADMVTLVEVKAKLQKRHTCTDLGELRRYLGLQITRDRAARTITLSQSHMVQQVIQRFGLQHSTTQPTPLAVDHRLTGPFPNESFEASVRGPLSEGLNFESQCVHFGHPSARGCQRSTGDPRLILGKGYRHVGLGGYGRTDPLLNKPFYPNVLVVGILIANGPYAELVGCLMCVMTCTRPDLAFPLSSLSQFFATRRHRPVHWTAAVRVANHLATTSRLGFMLGGRQPVVLTGHCDSSYADDVETQRSSKGYCFIMGTGAVSWRSTWSTSVASSSAEAEIYVGAMAAQDLR
ncbi:unnamed protein product, partial [Closterium sp. NIES-53]